MRKFNTTAVCIPSKHYMVDLTSRIAQIKEMILAGEYFTINRARQYGKTTMLNALRNELSADYFVISLSFQGISSSGFATEEQFVQDFCKIILKKKMGGFIIPADIDASLSEYASKNNPDTSLGVLNDTLTQWCSIAGKPIVLMIDEVDSASNNQVFLDFLAQLRDGYISRNTEDLPYFQSVILAGVTDVKHLKGKIRDEDQHKVNSPWNIAADFLVDMSFNRQDIQGMLDDYETDHKTGMDTSEIAGLLEDYTAGYPFLVSRLCQLIDTVVSKQLGSLSDAWTKAGFEEAIKLILAEKNTLFQSLTGKLTNYPELKKSLRKVLMEGLKIPYNPDQEDIIQMEMYGFIKSDRNTVRIANRIFETRLYNLFLSEEEIHIDIFTRKGDLSRNIFVTDGRLDMPLILEHFIRTYTEVFGPLKEKFKEKDGREQFLLYLKPIINGTGNYYIEAQTRDQTRTDVVVDYLGQQYVIELKIWHGERYNARGEQQLKDYLNYFNLDTGYMLSFNFNEKKEVGVKRVMVDDKVLFEAML